MRLQRGPPRTRRARDSLATPLAAGSGAAHRAAVATRFDTSSIARHVHAPHGVIVSDMRLQAVATSHPLGLQGAGGRPSRTMRRVLRILVASVMALVVAGCGLSSVVVDDGGPPVPPGNSARSCNLMAAVRRSNAEVSRSRNARASATWMARATSSATSSPARRSAHPRRATSVSTHCDRMGGPSSSARAPGKGPSCAGGPAGTRIQSAGSQLGSV